MTILDFTALNFGPIFAANWKCNLDLTQVRAFVQWAEHLKKPPRGHVVLFSSSCYLPLLLAHAKDWVWMGAQDVSTVERGAYTGEVAAFQLKSLGVQMVLLGHSERRYVFGEQDNILAQKLKRLMDVDLPACFCVGETQAQRDRGQTVAVVTQQLQIFLDSLKQAFPSSHFAKQSILAYEPVWAIGTGKNATSKDIEQVHEVLQNILDQHGNKGLPVLYGGSVKGSNASKILQTKGVDGVLVGGASNTPAGFDEIRAAAT